MNMRKKLCVISILIFSALPLGAWTLFENFESRAWYDPHWADWFRLGTATYGNYQGRNCVKLTGPTDKGAQSIITNFFPGEDWSGVALIKLDIYAQTAVTNTTAKLEPCSPADTPCVASTALPLNTVNSWVTCTWNYAIPAASPVSKVQLIFDNLAANAATYYIDNLRLVLADGTTHYWDDFDDARTWSVAGSTALWSGLPEFVSHNASTSTANGGAGTLWWNYTGPATAELMTSVPVQDWSAYNMVRADVRCSSTDIPIRCYFWLDGWGEETAPRRVTQSDTWQTLYWQLPAGATTYSVRGFNLRLDTSALTPSGTCYIDNISLGNVAVTVVKSTAVAAARPQEPITYTLTYGNAGTDGASNLVISDVVPFNSYISQAAAAGSADGVEYFVGGSWTAAYNAAATKIRWKDSNVAAGSSGLSVSYTVKVK